MKWRALCVLLSVSSCAPAVPKPDTSIAATAYLPPDMPGGAAETASPGSNWWQSFGNAELDRLVATALQASPSIASANATLAAALFNNTAATGATLPQIGLAPSVSRQSYPTGPNGSPPYTIYSLTGTISYDPGLFGARPAVFANAAAQAAYQQAELDAARQSVAGNTAAAAIGYAGEEAQIDATRTIIAAEQRLLTLLNGEYAYGAIPQLNVLQQQSVILAAEATLPPLQTQADQLRDRLAILTGSLPQNFMAPPLTLQDFAPAAVIPVALPSTYLANRPDIRAARAVVAAQNAALGLAVAHLYPDLTLTAQGGYAAQTLGTLFQPASGLWTLAGNLLQPLYDGGILRARRQAAQANLTAALADYRSAVLNAFGAAADALQALQNDQAADVSAGQANQTAQRAASLAKQQYALGAVDYTTVLTAQATANQQALIMVQVRTALLLDRARLQSIMAW